MLAIDLKEELQQQLDALLDDGRLVDARIVCRRIVELAPLDLEAWLSLAAIEAELGEVNSSLLCCDKAIEIDRDDAEAHVMRGRLLVSAGEIELARGALEQAVRLDRDDGEAWNVLSAVLLKQGCFQDAQRCAREAVRLLPSMIEGHINLGNALAGTGLLADARTSFEQAVKLDACNGLAWVGMALVCEREQDMPAARQAYEKANEYLPNQIGRAGLARVLVALGELVLARQLLMQMLDLNPADSEACRIMGSLCLANGQTQEAEAYYTRALQHNAANLSALVDMGNLMQARQHFPEAEAYYTKVLEIAPEHPEAIFNQGVCKQRQGEYAEALACFDLAIESKPDFVEAHWYKAFANLLVGDYAQGWDEYEWRLRQKQNISRPIRQAAWNGEDLAGKTILIHDEQGYGDTFQFVRYLPLVKALGARVVFECHAGLGQVLRGGEGYDEIHERISPQVLPDTAFDTHAHLLSLPRIFGTRPDTVPVGIPYIRADADRFAYWQKRVAGDTGFKVGIVWAGSPNHTNELNRSCPLRAFTVLADLPSLRLYSLQKGPGSEQADLMQGIEIRRLDRELDQKGRFVDTAALMACLDLIITIDTSIAHLAGAMGRPVWTLLCANPDWRWGLVGEDTPWYPSMRLFRQNSSGDWEGVLDRVRLELKRMIP